jgi:hypothetical protein
MTLQLLPPIKKWNLGSASGLKTVIPATQEAEVGGLKSEACQAKTQDPIWKQTEAKRVGGRDGRALAKSWVQAKTKERNEIYSNPMKVFTDQVTTLTEEYNTSNAAEF